MRVELNAVTISFLALIGPALLMLGWWLSALAHSTKSAHKRIDGLEKMLKEEMRLTRTELRDAIEHAWVNCPMAQKGGHHDK